MSDTPHTDDELFAVRSNDDKIIDCVPANFARRQERKITVVDAQLNQCKKMLAARDAEVERLHWIECNPIYVPVWNQDHRRWVIRDEDEFTNLQEAIDAARAALAQPKEPT